MKNVQKIKYITINFVTSLIVVLSIHFYLNYIFKIVQLTILQLIFISILVTLLRIVIKHK